MSGILLSPKHGVNPSLAICWICGEDNGEIILPGRLKGDAEAPRRAVWNREPCKQCKEWKAMGIILISVRDGESGDNPHRSGAIAVVKDEAVRRFVHSQELLNAILRHRMAFIPDTAWGELGLPRGNSPEKERV